MIDDRLTPIELRRALDDIVAGVRLRELQEASERLSATYRGHRAGVPADAPAWTHLDRLAYLAARMPATYRATSAVLTELRSRCPSLRIDSLLDIGAGPATALWATVSEFTELSHATLIEPDAAMVTLAQRLLVGSSPAARVDANWITATVDRTTPMPVHDLVVAGYLLGELDADRRQAVVDAAWDACRGAVAFIEPGSAEGSRRVLDARRRLVTLGAALVAPCPHDRPCPLPSDDWCHFAVRLNRTALQRHLKRGTLAYEDEKYSYVIATRGSDQPSRARVIRRPQTKPGRVMLQLCTREGLRDETVTRRRDTYRQARKVRWGDSWPVES